ncbi:MAG: glycoside hydrolase family 3 C-terminal domain-containing protein, partial [Clostridiales bacterium]|nr:glycoside hydrolase family 3 C-terminal domain-containing protein [Clostridiales bacterium]
VNAHNKLAEKIAVNSAVLLKNEDNILPLSKSSKVALIGDMAKNARYQGAGSSFIHPTMLDSAYQALQDRGISFTYAQGVESNSDKLNQVLIEEACKVAKDADVAIIYAGLTDAYDSEGFDREHMKIPQNHINLIESVSKVNKNTIVVLSGGSAVEMEWIDSVKGLLNIFLSGQASGNASISLIFGENNPCGKLSETYPYKYADTPAYNNFPGGNLTVEYRESIFVGYRYYDTAKVNVRFPFGFGLSYTSFEYSDLKLEKTKIKDDEKLKLSFKVKNTGKVAGSEIAQLYIKDIESTIFRPEKELKEFAKVYLEPNEEKEITFELGKRAFAYFNVNINDWHIESGDFEVMVGSSSRDIKLRETVTITSSDENVAIPDYRESAPEYYNGKMQEVSDASFKAVLGRDIPQANRDADAGFDLSSTFDDLRATKMGNFIYTSIWKSNYKAMKVKDENDKSFRMIMASFGQTPLRSNVTMSKGMFTEKMANGVIDICTNHKIRGVGRLLSGIPNAIVNLKNINK